MIFVVTLRKMIIMRKILFPILCAAAVCASAIDVKTVRKAGPFKVVAPVVIDSVNAAQKKYTTDAVLQTPIVLNQVRKGQVAELCYADSAKNCQCEQMCKGSLMLASFSFATSAYTKAEVKVSGPKLYKVYVNGKETSGKRDYQMGQYEVIVKFVADTAALKLSVNADKEDALSIVPLDGTEATKRPFNMGDLMEMKHYTGISVSPSGKYATYGIYWTDAEAKSQRQNRLVELATGKVLSTQILGRWMPKSDRMLTVRNVDGKNVLLSIDPIDLSEEILCADMPETSYTMSPTEDFLILHKTIEGPKRETGVYEVLTPDDRQPGWRNRSQLLKLDLKTGITQPLTYGNKSVYLADIAPDGKSLIFSYQEERLTKRPMHLSTYVSLNLETMECDTLISREGFMNSLNYVPGTDKLVLTASPEAFDGIGCILPDSLTASIYDYQLYLYDLKTKAIHPVSCNFDPSIASVHPAQADGIVYFTANNADSVSLYRLDAKTGKIAMVKQPMELVSGVSVSPYGNTMLYAGSGACVADRLCMLNTKNHKYTELDNCNAERYDQIAFGECYAISMDSKRGYKLTGHYYLPANFDKTKKYPVIVHYYGGCTPTSRRFGGGGHYPAHYWNANGYIVLICNPSGASGFGQEWASRHVNTMGEGVAEDIMELTQYFSDQNPWVDATKIGCVSASYGGFMTQLLLTKSNMFAAGISHAGISDHTSYWGEGYWGYNYSQVCAANSYPWSRKDLFVDRSPLYNADKINTPLLFTHGTADTNVPIGESIQMYTALKLLGKETAFVMVEGENHGIMDYHKRQRWINTMVAWFDKYLKGDDAWWKAIYVPKEL